MKATARIAAGAACLAIVGGAYALLRPHDAARPQSPAQNSASSPPTQNPVAQNPAPAQDTKPLPDKTPPLTLLGTVIAGAQAALSVRQPARIASVLIKESQAVRQGQVLVVLDMRETQAGQQGAQAGVGAALAQADKAHAARHAQEVKADADISTAQAGVTQARAKLRQAQTGVQAARAADKADLETAQAGVRKADIGLQTAQTNLTSLEKLSAVGGVARNDLESARAQVQSAQNDLETAHAAARRVQDGPQSFGSGSPEKVNAVNTDTNPAANNRSGVTFRVANAQQEAAQAQTGVTQAQAGLKAARQAKTQTLAIADADIQAALAALAQARAGLKGAQIGQQAGRLTSPLNGIASNITARAGEIAQPGAPLLTVVSPSGARIEALVPARQLAQLRVGQPARIALDTRPDPPLGAVVSAIAAIAEPDGRAFRVTFQITRPVSFLRVGQNARIQIDIRP